MPNQLLATFYVQAPEFLFEDISVTAEVQYQSGTGSTGSWYQNSSELTATVTNAHYDDPANGNNLRRRYKIEVFRVESQTYDYTTYETVYYYSLFKAGTYKRRLSIKFNNVEVLERMILLTIQPDLTVTVGETPLITTSRTNTTSNPANHTVTVNVMTTTSALAARKILLNGINEYKGTVLVKSNCAVDSYSDDLAVETSNNYTSSTWLKLADKIWMTRKVGSNEYRWTTYSYFPCIVQDDRGKYAAFISGDGNSGTNLLNTDLVKAGTAVELGFQKMPLTLPLRFQSALSLCGRAVERFTGSGETVETTNEILLPLTVILKTAHRINITPAILTLDEDNNYTSFVAIEANEGANWTLAPVNSKLTVTPSSGTGRAALVVKAVGRPQTVNISNVEKVTLTATSTVNAATYPDIDGAYTATNTSAVHIEQYAPARNALIPKMTRNSTAISSAASDAWKSFDHSLTSFGGAGQWVDGLGSNWTALDNIDSFPAIEITLDKAHRVRSWSLQSVGTGNSLGRLASMLVLRGQTLDNQWKILDIAGLSYNFYSNDKIREDRTVHSREVVSKIRISVIATQGSGNIVSLPQIQVFAGVPIVPTMTSGTTGKVSVQSSGGNTGLRVFDKKVSGNDVAFVGAANWYLNMRNTPLNDVAINGTVRRFINDQHFDSSSSLCWLVVSFPKNRLIGYLYSIDDLSVQSQHANTPYAASLYFEGRETSDASATTQDSIAGKWDEIGLISLDKCIGRATSAAPSSTDLNTWAQSVLKLTGAGRDKAFIIANNEKILYPFTVFLRSNVCNVVFPTLSAP